MAKTSFIALTVILTVALAGAQELAKVEDPGSELKPAFTGSSLTCSPTRTLVIPSPLIERAKLKARLLTLLRDSLLDDAKGIVNIAREKEIKKLANKLRSQMPN